MKNDNPLKNKAPVSPKSTVKKYENNPFFVATSGLELLFEKGRSVAIALVVLSVVAAFNTISDFTFPDFMNQPQNNELVTKEIENLTQNITSIPAEVWVLGSFLAVVALIFVILFAIIVRGVSDYAASQLAQDKTATLTEALRAVFERFWSYVWVIVIVSVKTFLWSLLLIVPGIVMAYRYSLAGVSFFSGKGKGDEAVQHSSQLVKGAWLTTYASTTLFGIVTLGLIEPLIAPSANAILYRQLNAVRTKKPKAHILSWLTLLLPLVLMILVMSIISSLVANSRV